MDHLDLTHTNSQMASLEACPHESMVREETQPSNPRFIAQ